MKKYLIILILLIVISIQAYSSEWSFEHKEPYYRNIEVTYVNEEAENKGTIRSFVHQQQPISHSGAKVLLGLESQDNCFESTMVVRNSDGEEVWKQSEYPYSPYSNCEDPPTFTINYGTPQEYQEKQKEEGNNFLTSIIFYLPEESGDYILEVMDKNDVIFTKAKVTVLHPDTEPPKIERTSYTDYSGDEYSLTISAPYPIIFDENTAGTFDLIISGPSISIAEEMFEILSAEISTQYARYLYLLKEGDVTCSETSCTQKYQINSSSSTSGIVSVWREVDFYKVSQNSESVSILDRGKINQIKDRVEKMLSITTEFIEYYESKDDEENLIIWRSAHEKIDNIDKNLKELYDALDSGDYKIKHIVELTRIADTYKDDIYKIINDLRNA